MELKKLQEIGAMADSLALVSVGKSNSISVSAFQQLSEQEQATLNKVVTVDNPDWVATTKAKPAEEAKTVYSCHGDEIGCWVKGTSFSFMRLMDNRVATFKRIKISKNKEDKNMDAMMDMESFDADFSADAATAVETAGKEPSEAQKKRDAYNKEISSIREKIAGQALADVSDMVYNNQRNGRLLFFIARTDSAVKPSRTKIVRYDENGKAIPDKEKLATATEANRKKYEESGKYPKAVCETDTVVSFKSYKPGKVIGVAVETPVGSEVQLTKLTSSEKMLAKESKDTVVRIMNMEQAFVYLPACYRDKIKESEKLMGTKASQILIEPKLVEVKKKGETFGQKQMKIVLKPVKSENGRKVLLTEGNYFPVKTYKTVKATGASAEDAAALNLNFKSMFKDNGKYEELNEDAKKNVWPEGDSYKSVWFDKGETIAVKPYDAVDASAQVSDVAIPVKQEKVSKTDPTKKTYPFVYDDLDSPAGPLNNSKYQKLIEATKMSKDEFSKKIKSISKVNRQSSGARKASLTAEDYLRAIANKQLVQIDTGVTHTIAQLASEIAD